MRPSLLLMESVQIHGLRDGPADPGLVWYLSSALQVKLGEVKGRRRLDHHYPFHMYLSPKKELW